MSENDKRKTYVIFGGYGSVGCALANRLINSPEQNAQLLLCGRDEARLALVADSLGASHFPADLTKFNEVQDCIDLALDKFGKIDGVANCVATSLIKPAHLTIEREWREIININLTTAFACIRYSAHAMLESGGSIVLISPSDSTSNLPDRDAMNMAQAGIEALTQSAAATYAKYKIRVNAVAQGAENCGASEMAEVLEYLLTEQSHWITGQILPADRPINQIRFEFRAGA